MEQGTATGSRAWVIRSGRPPRALAGEVEARILDAARKIFLERGLEGASIDEIADAAHAGKPTIYARFPGKEALFAAVILRKVRENLISIESVAPTGVTFEERLASIATAILRRVLAAETVGLCRVTVAEARRFPDLAASVHRMARERTSEAVSQLLGELPEADQLPAFAADRRATTARQFIELIVQPMLMRALFGEDLTALRAEIGPHVARTVAFFLAGCRHGGIS
ncbi:MAG: TetR/AcrR family transcriptional regulator [Alphaproteobacteria bacterium]|nr:TetR/AcrR family transcriptional regulator [Alphaproteobacteria bacterium]MBV9376504.1 TetR/AcrR family transcriptional regulator [Alphaproteobacteria bacterium]